MACSWELQGTYLLRNLKKRCFVMILLKISVINILITLRHIVQTQTLSPCIFVWMLLLELKWKLMFLKSPYTATVPIKAGRCLHPHFMGQSIVSQLGHCVLSWPASIYPHIPHFHRIIPPIGLTPSICEHLNWKLCSIDTFCISQLCLMLDEFPPSSQMPPFGTDIKWAAAVRTNDEFYRY